MKRSKLFLGITTCLLAITGVAAINHFDNGKIRYYCTVGNGTISYCKSAGMSTYLFTTDTNTPIATITFTYLFTVYTRLLYTKGTVGQLCGDGCTNTLHYNQAN